MTPGYRSSGGGSVVSDCSLIRLTVLTPIGAKSNAENEGMVADAFDLSFFGVSNIWNNDLGKARLMK